MNSFFYRTSSVAAYLSITWLNKSGDYDYKTFINRTLINLCVRSLYALKVLSTITFSYVVTLQEFDYFVRALNFKRLIIVGRNTFNKCYHLMVFNLLNYSSSEFHNIKIQTYVLT